MALVGAAGWISHRYTHKHCVTSYVPFDTEREHLGRIGAERKVGPWAGPPTSRPPKSTEESISLGAGEHWESTERAIPLCRLFSPRRRRREPKGLGLYCGITAANKTILNNYCYCDEFLGACINYDYRWNSPLCWEFEDFG